MKRPGALGVALAVALVGVPVGIIGAIRLTASSSEEDLGEKYAHAVQRAWGKFSAGLRRGGNDR